MFWYQFITNQHPQPTITQPHQQPPPPPPPHHHHHHHHNRKIFHINHPAFRANSKLWLKKKVQPTLANVRHKRKIFCPLNCAIKQQIPYTLESHAASQTMELFGFNVYNQNTNLALHQFCLNSIWEWNGIWAPDRLESTSKLLCESKSLAEYRRFLQEPRDDVLPLAILSAGISTRFGEK